MLKFFRSVITKNNPEAASVRPSRDALAPEEIMAEGFAPFPIVTHMSTHNGLPILDWDAARSWVEEGQSEEQQGLAWAACEHAWLMHFSQALGPGYGLTESNTAVLVSSLEPNVSRATLDYMGRTLRRVTRVLDGIAQVPTRGKDILIVFDDDACYYNYVSYYYPEEGEFVPSGGMQSGHLKNPASN